MKSCLSSKNGIVKTYVWTALESLNVFMLANFLFAWFKGPAGVVETTWINYGCPLAQSRMFWALMTCLIPRCLPDCRTYLDLVYSSSKQGPAWDKCCLPEHSIQKLEEVDYRSANANITAFPSAKSKCSLKLTTPHCPASVILGVALLSRTLTREWTPCKRMLPES